MKTILCLTAGLLVFVSGVSAACEQDKDCKGGGVCKSGMCLPAADKDTAASSTVATKLPEFCCTTAAGRLGLSSNPNPTTGKTIREGEPCYAKTAQGRTTYGKACF